MTTQSWLLLILVLVVLAIIWWWWWNRRSKALPPASRQDLDTPLSTSTKQTPSVSLTPPIVSGPSVTPPTVSAPEVAPGVTTAPPASVRPDDLTIVEGIGPKIAGLLQAAGIQTLAQLSVTDTAKLTAILNAAKLQFSDPTTWPEQAGLAAAGKMDELAAMQDSLRAGRRK